MIGMQRYRAIIIDPPWKYDAPIAAFPQSAERQYPVMSIPELKNIHIPAEPDCLLFMWVTNFFLCDGTGPMLMKHWGFNPLTLVTWAKVQLDGITPSPSVGHWFRSASEHIIIGMKGKIQRRVDYPVFPTWFATKRLPHSVKPDDVHEFAEAAVPEGPWLEMFARRSRKGWDAWGGEDLRQSLEAACVAEEIESNFEIIEGA